MMRKAIWIPLLSITLIIIVFWLKFSVKLVPIERGDIPVLPTIAKVKDVRPEKYGVLEVMSNSIIIPSKDTYLDSGLYLFVNPYAVQVSNTTKADHIHDIELYEYSFFNVSFYFFKINCCIIQEECTNPGVCQ